MCDCDLDVLFCCELITELKIDFSVLELQRGFASFPLVWYAEQIQRKGEVDLQARAGSTLDWN